MEYSSFDFSEKYPDQTFHHNLWTKSLHRQSRISKTLTSYHKKLESNRNQRLALGLLLVVIGVVVAARPQSQEWGLAFLVLLPVFIWKIIKTNRLHRFTAQLNLLLTFYQRQTHKIQGGVLNLEPIKPLENLHNPDLNILGAHSIFSQLDETFSLEASQKLASRLNNGLSTLQEIHCSHEKIQHLNRYFPVARRFLIEGHSAEEPILLSDLEQVFNHSIITPGYKWNMMAHAVLFPGYLIVFFMIGYGKIQAPLALPIAVYAAFALSSLKCVLASFRQGEILERSLTGLIPVFSFAEKRTQVFAKDLPTLKNKSFSKTLSHLKHYVSFLSIQSHALAYLVVNALCPWTFVFSGLTEMWRKKNKTQFLKLLKEMTETEVSASLTVYYHYQTQTLPELGNSFVLNIEDAYHPLISRDQVVANSLKLDGHPAIILLTGSNMSGKSTFMRTLAVNQTLAMAGAPVFAKKMLTTLAPVISCMQIKDSLEMGYSYFYAEVRKVKQILQQVSEGKRTFFFIDEIFKGTNNRERLIGSQAVIQKLSEYPEARGIISTHDLELAQVAGHQTQVANYHFRDDINKSELIFSYKIQKGPCPTTNAIKIMKSEGLPIPE